MRNAFEGTDMGPMNRVHEGMHVVDATGKDVGSVEMVQMGDSQAATTAGNEDRNTGLLEAVARAIDEREPDVPEPLRSRLVQHGYLKIDGPGLLESDRYVPGNYVRDVSDDRVRLSVTRDELAKEH